MWHLKLRRPVARASRFSRGTPLQNGVVLLGLALCISVLASCGTAVAGQANPGTPTPTLVPSPTVSPTSAPTPTPTPKPTATPTPTPQPIVVPPTQPPPAATPPVATPAILDLRPASMSMVGHLDCQKQGAYICFARVLSRSSNSSDLHWVDFTNVPGGVVFRPVSGVLAPGQGVLVTITVPFTACTPGLFFFQGPINTHTITWAC